VEEAVVAEDEVEEVLVELIVKVVVVVLVVVVVDVKLSKNMTDLIEIFVLFPSSRQKKMFVFYIVFQFCQTNKYLFQNK
jgi:hypothetical protein